MTRKWFDRFGSGRTLTELPVDRRSEAEQGSVGRTAAAILTKVRQGVHHHHTGVPRSFDQPNERWDHLRVGDRIDQRREGGEIADDTALALHRHDRAAGRLGQRVRPRCGELTVGRAPGSHRSTLRHVTAKSEDAPPALILASTSRYRASLFAELGLEFEVTAPDFDERTLDGEFATTDPGEFAVRLARGKAMSVAHGRSGCVIVAADQLAVIDRGRGPELLHQTPDADAAFEQLRSMSDTTHELVNGIVVLAVDDGQASAVTAVDRHLVTMRRFSDDEARQYIDRFRPFDCVGSYRIEDDADLIESVSGGHRSGVIGLPLPTMRTLLTHFGYTTSWTPDRFSGPDAAS